MQLKELQDAAAAKSKAKGTAGTSTHPGSSRGYRRVFDRMGDGVQLVKRASQEGLRAAAGGARHVGEMAVNGTTDMLASMGLGP